MNKTQSMALGKLVAKARIGQELTYRDVEDGASVASAWVMRLEKGEYIEPAPDRVMDVLDFLGIDIAKADRATGGYLRQAMPSSRAYFRAKYNLTPEQTEQIEQEIKELKRRKR